MIEDFFSAFQNFLHSKTRTFLSLLGVIIGVASVIVITSLGASSTKTIQSTFGTSGLDLVQISAGFMNRRNHAAMGIEFDENFRSELFDQIKNVKKIWYKNSFSSTLNNGDSSLSSQCTAVETGYLDICGAELDSGEFFNATDDFYGTQKIVLGSQVASGLFPEGNAVGKNIIVVIEKTSFSFNVAGVLKETTSGLDSNTTGIYVPRGFYAKKVKPHPAASTVMLQATSSAHCTQISTDVKEYFTEKTGNEYAVNVMSMQTMIDQVSSITKTLSLMLSGIAAISLLVGGIGIMNIMIVTVTERKQEIGIRKALGASPFAIKRQFLVESASITLIGGTLGIILGLALSFAVEYIKSQPYAIQWQSVAVAFVFSVAIGVFFGLNPAIRAAKLDPVVALSGE